MRLLKKSTLLVCMLSLVVTLPGCESLGIEGGDTSSFPQPEEVARRNKRGRIGGDEGLISFGGPEDGEGEGGGNNPLGVNSFLWRATLDTIAFLPIASADPFGGVVLTDWYEDPETPGERFKVNALILDRALRADSIRISLFKQVKDGETDSWQDATIAKSKARSLEDAILTRARQLRVAQLGY